jgi:hypothetical protein
MRHHLRAGCKFDSLNVHTGFCRVAIYDCGLNCRGANGRRELNFIRKFDDGLGSGPFLVVPSNPFTGDWDEGRSDRRPWRYRPPYKSRENEKYLP